MNNVTNNGRHELLSVVPLDLPYVIYVDVCGYCNFSCSFCPCNSSSYKQNERHKLLDYHNIERLCEDLGGGECQVIYLGCFGEPLLNPRIIDMIHILKASKACRELRILTNGYLLSQDLNEKIVGAGADLVRVSIEGLSADDYWKFCKVKLDYDKFISNLNDLFMRSRGTATKVSAKIIAAGLESNEDLQLFQKMFSSITDTCFCENISSGWPFFESGLKKIVGAGQLTYETADEAAKHVCSYPLTHLVVFANGSVGVCCSDWRMDTVVGDLGSQSIYDIWNGEALHAFRRKHLLRQKAEASPSCGVCSMYPPDNIDNDAEKILRRLESLENYSSKVAKE